MMFFQHVVSFKDLFIAPTFDELEQVAMDGAKNGAKKLSEQQLNSVRLQGSVQKCMCQYWGLLKTG